jgi:hypothetical protein
VQRIALNHEERVTIFEPRLCINDGKSARQSSEHGNFHISETNISLFPTELIPPDMVGIAPLAWHAPSHLVCEDDFADVFHAQPFVRAKVLSTLSQVKLRRILLIPARNLAKE